MNHHEWDVNKTLADPNYQRRRDEVLAGMEEAERAQRLASLEKASRNEWWTPEREAEMVRRAEEEGHARRLARIQASEAIPRKDVARADVSSAAVIEPVRKIRRVK